MFSDFQDFSWIVFGDLVVVGLWLLINVSAITLIIVVIDRVMFNLLAKLLKKSD